MDKDEPVDRGAAVTATALRRRAPAGPRCDAPAPAGARRGTAAPVLRRGKTVVVGGGVAG